MPFQGDTSRIVNLPVRVIGDVSTLVATHSAAWRRHPAAPPLRPIQAIALEELTKAPEPRGIFGPIGVGHGKTLIAFLAGSVARAQRPLLLTEPGLLRQCRADLNTWAKHYTFPRPTLLSYGRLSHVESSALLERLRPDLVVLDEAHALRSADSARTKRVMRYAIEHPAVRWVVLSGSFTTASIKDYAHLTELALRDGTFLPTAEHTLDHWANVLDANGIPSTESIHVIRPLIARWGTLDPEHTLATKAREALANRAHATPGVVATRESAVHTPLTIRRVGYPVDDVVSAALAVLESTWELPNGEMLTDALSYYRASVSLAAGFYYEIQWGPDGPDFQYLEARQAWSKVIRDSLRGNARENFDSPALVTNAAKAGTAPARVCVAWEQWAKVKDRQLPPSRTIWLSMALPCDVMARVTSDAPPCTVWYRSIAMRDALSLAGYRTFDDSGTVPDARETPHPALSYRMFGKGKNLQSYSNALVVEPSANGATWEQLLGRHHRPGQANPVVFTTYDQPGPFAKALAKALAEAKYIEQSTKAEQKLNLAKWE